MKNKISIIIPFFNEEWNIIPLYEKIIHYLKLDFKKFNYEIIMINDWSTDNSWKEICSCNKNDKNIIWINLNKNYWQSIAMDAGFKKAIWKYIFSLDWDWQNDPKDMIRLYNKLIEEDLDIVAWWRKKRNDPLWMLIITKTAKFLRKLMINDWVNDSWCTLRIYKKEVIKNIYLWAEMHRYIIAISKINGFKIWELQVNHRARTIWKSKYNWQKSIKWLIDLFYIWFISKYESRPLHLFGFLGILNFFIWSSFILFSIYQKIFIWLPLNKSWWLLIGIFLFQIWVILFIFGILIDIMIRNYYNTSKESRYIIREEI